jgi:hypothetical protein
MRAAIARVDTAAIEANEALSLRDEVVSQIAKSS